MLHFPTVEMKVELGLCVHDAGGTEEAFSVNHTGEIWLHGPSVMKGKRQKG
uniref:Uncharacterized protein n=1 Tax=Nelumbo nucifera TaxID=4432 RepID=A0A822YKS3_NELNU|nr:TPA_asm: hypothetical protein HUJ06_011022 [Nelumbo nucifera]